MERVLLPNNKLHQKLIRGSKEKRVTKEWTIASHMSQNRANSGVLASTIQFPQNPIILRKGESIERDQDNSTVQKKNRIDDNKQNTLKR